MAGAQSFDTNTNTPDSNLSLAQGLFRAKDCSANGSALMAAPGGFAHPFHQFLLRSPASVEHDSDTSTTIVLRYRSTRL
jgi:hypothetical protein